MDPEVQAYFEGRMKEPTFLDKIKNKIELIKLKESDIKDMKKVLIEEAKPLFSDFWLNRKDRNTIDKLSVDCFDKRIMSLPKKNILELYSELMDLKKAESKEAKEYMYNSFLTNLSLHYSLDGWFLKKAFKYIRTGRI